MLPRPAESAGMDFDGVVDAYDAARPDYPDELYDALPPLDGAVVVEGGAGTGIATRALRARGARVVATDIGRAMLGRVDGWRVVADAARAPFRAGCADLVTFAQSWHWLDLDLASGEVARLLRDGGAWAGWWNHVRNDGEAWFETYWSFLERNTPARREHRDTDWGATLDGAHFHEPAFTSVAWAREVTLSRWLEHERSISYIGLSPQRERLVTGIESILRSAFGDGPVRLRYETWLWQATKR